MSALGHVRTLLAAPFYVCISPESRHLRVWSPGRIYEHTPWQRGNRFHKADAFGIQLGPKSQSLPLMSIGVVAVEQLIAAVSGFAEEGMLVAHDEAYSLLLSPCAPGSSSKATPLTQ